MIDPQLSAISAATVDLAVNQSTMSLTNAARQFVVEAQNTENEAERNFAVAAIALIKYETCLRMALKDSSEFFKQMEKMT